MNDTTKLVLENQRIIMCVLRDVADSFDKPGYLESLNEQIQYTKELLNPEDSDTEEKIKESPACSEAKE